MTARRCTCSPSSVTSVNVGPPPLSDGSMNSPPQGEAERQVPVPFADAEITWDQAGQVLAFTAADLASDDLGPEPWPRAFRSCGFLVRTQAP